MFMILTLLFFLFLISGYLYVGLILLSIFSIMSSYFIFLFINNTERKKVITLFVLFISIVGIIVPNSLLYEEIDGKYPYYISENTINTGIYMKYNGDHNGIGDYIYTRRIDTFTNDFYGYNLNLGYDHIDKFNYESVKPNYKSIFNNPKNIYVINGWYWNENIFWKMRAYKTLFINNTINNKSVRNWLLKGDISYYIADEKFQNNILTRDEEWVEEHKEVRVTIPFHRYKIYRNDNICVYHL